MHSSRTSLSAADRLPFPHIQNVRVQNCKQNWLSSMKKCSAFGIGTFPLLTSGSAPKPRWGLRPQTLRHPQRQLLVPPLQPCTMWLFLTSRSYCHRVLLIPYRRNVHRHQLCILGIYRHQLLPFYIACSTLTLFRPSLYFPQRVVNHFPLNLNCPFWPRNVVNRGICYQNVRPSVHPSVRLSVYLPHS